MSEKLTKLTAPFNPSFKKFARLIHLDSYPEAEGEARELFDAARRRLIPKSVFCTAFIEEREVLYEGVHITARGVPFCGKVLTELADVHRVFPYIITCGNEMENYDLSGLDMLAPFWLDTLKTMALGAARLYTISQIQERLGLGKLNSVNPGSGNVDIWPVQELRGIFSLLDNGDPAGVFLTESSLMIPNKTISGLLYESEKSFTSCQYCEREHCPGRKEEFAGTRL
jgi:hypothetical protein